MPLLEIRHTSGDVEHRDLTKALPISIGKHPSNDICVAEDGVATMHCRISWNKKGFEVVAAGKDGVDLNGTLVRHAAFEPGDVIRIGDIDIGFLDESGPESVSNPAAAEPPPRTSSPPESEMYGLKPITADSLPAGLDRWRRVRAEPGPAPAVPVREREADPPKPAAPAAKPAPRVVAADSEPILESWEVAEERTLPVAASRPARSVSPPPKRLWLTERPVRPGEQELLRSPLVLTLGGGVAALLITALTLYLVIGRQSALQQYNQALAAYEERRFGDAIPQFEAFIKAHPRHGYANAARLGMGFARVEQAVSGAAPAWDRGLKLLKEFIESAREIPEFAESRPRVRRLIEQIALGSAAAAGPAHSRELLTVTADARQLLQVQGGDDERLPALLEQIDEAVRTASTMLRQHEGYSAALEKIDKALQDNQPLIALETRRLILEKYADLERDRALRERLPKMLAAELKLVGREAPERTALVADRPTPVTTSLTLVRRTRARSDLGVEGSTVLVLAGDACFGVNTFTGQPQWRRTVGAEPGFFPVPVYVDGFAALVFDSRYRDLLALRLSDGALIWRQPLEEPAAGPPLVHAGQVFLATRTGRLWQFDLQSGLVRAVLTFSQPIAAPPVLLGDGEHLAVAGRQGVIYRLRHRPLECVGVSFIGHGPGAIEAPLLKLGEFVLVCENDRQESSKLSVWDASAETGEWRFLTSSRIPGLVRDEPVLRGKQLFVPSSDERISAFMVAAKADASALTAAARYQVEQPRGGPMHIVAGPNDELWMAAGSLRRFKLASDTIVPLGGMIPLGRAAQPVQVVDQELFVAGRQSASPAVSLISVDRERMTGQWQGVFGARGLALTAPAADGQSLCLTDTGDVYGVSQSKLGAGGFDVKPLATLPLPDSNDSPLSANLLDDGRLAAYCGGSEPKLWIIGAAGAVERTVKLPVPLEAPPLHFHGGILLPLPGALKWLGAATVKTGIEDYLAPVEPERPPHWRQIVRLDEEQVLAMTVEGAVSRLELRLQPVAHLFEVTRIDLKAPIDQPAWLEAKRLHVAAGRQLLVLDANTLETRAAREFEQALSHPPAVGGGRLFVVSGREELSCLDSEHDLPLRWKLPLAGRALVGQPVAWQDALIVALNDGELLRIEPDTGTIARRVALGQALVLGPRLIDGQLVVATADGSLQVVTAALEAAP